MGYTVTLSEADAADITAVSAEVETLPLYDPDFSGMGIAVETGDYTAVTGPDELAGARLLSVVYSALDAIRGENDNEPLTG